MEVYFDLHPVVSWMVGLLHTRSGLSSLLFLDIYAFIESKQRKSIFMS